MTLVSWLLNFSHRGSFLGLMFAKSLLVLLEMYIPLENVEIFSAREPTFFNFGLRLIACSDMNSEDSHSQPQLAWDLGVVFVMWHTFE